MHKLYVIVNEGTVRLKLKCGRGYSPSASRVLGEIQRIKSRWTPIAHDGSAENLLGELPSSRRDLHVVLVGAFENGSIQTYREVLQGAGYSVSSQDSACLVVNK